LPMSGSVVQGGCIYPGCWEAGCRFRNLRTILARGRWRKGSIRELTPPGFTVPLVPSGVRGCSLLGRRIGQEILSRRANDEETGGLSPGFIPTLGGNGGSKTGCCSGGTSHWGGGAGTASDRVEPRGEKTCRGTQGELNGGDGRLAGGEQGKPPRPQKEAAERKPRRLLACWFRRPKNLRAVEFRGS